MNTNFINQKLQKIIQKELDSLSEIISDLGLKKVPTLSFESENDPHCMHTNHTFSYKILEHSAILSSESDYMIHVNIPMLKKVLASYMVYFFSYRIVKRTIRYLLIHELRHIWQDESGFYIGMSYWDIAHSNGPCVQKIEEDADSYAASQFRNNKERDTYRFVYYNSGRINNAGAKEAKKAAKHCYHVNLIRSIYWLVIIISFAWRLFI